MDELINNVKHWAKEKDLLKIVDISQPFDNLSVDTSGGGPQGLCGRNLGFS